MTALEIPRPKKIEIIVKYDDNKIQSSESNQYECSYGVGKLFVMFENIVAAKQARYRISGRSYNGRTVVASFYPEQYFEIKDFSII